MYDELVANYRRASASPALRFENAALSDNTGDAPFFERQRADYARAGEAAEGGLRTQEGSLRHPVTLGGAGWFESTVKTITFDDLMQVRSLGRETSRDSPLLPTASMLVESSTAVASAQPARGWARPPCRHLKNQSCCCLGSGFRG